MERLALTVSPDLSEWMLCDTPEIFRNLRPCDNSFGERTDHSPS
jgi:hypothetical protein